MFAQKLRLLLYYQLIFSKTHLCECVSTGNSIKNTCFKSNRYDSLIISSKHEIDLQVFLISPLINSFDRQFSVSQIIYFCQKNRRNLDEENTSFKKLQRNDKLCSVFLIHNRF